MNIWILNALIIEVTALLGVAWVTATRRTEVAFLVGFNVMLPVSLVYLWRFPPFDARKAVILVMLLVYLLQMNWLLLLHHKYTAVPKVNARLPNSQKLVLPLVLTNTAGWIYPLPFYFAARKAGPLDAADYLALVVFVVGTVIHFLGDYQKQQFKSRPGAKDRLLDSGLWGTCRHPNYFGDFLTYVSFGIIGHSVWGWISPLVNLLQYLFDAIPKNERWAAEHYGEAWEDYVRRTKKFVPFLW